MKTSFYFVLWILVYPVLAIIGVPDKYAFIVALFAVWGISALLNKLMPALIGFERDVECGQILDSVYEGNVTAIKKRIRTDLAVNVVSAVYMFVTAFVVILTMAESSTGSFMSDCFALFVFAALAFAMLARSISLAKASARLRKDSTPEQCADIAVQTYGLDYATFYDQHEGLTYDQLMASHQPAHFKAFQIFSIVFAAITALLGIICVIFSIVLWSGIHDFEAKSVAAMTFLYGTLALYFGVKDFIDLFKALRHKKLVTNEETLNSINQSIKQI